MKRYTVTITIPTQEPITRNYRTFEGAMHAVRQLAQAADQFDASIPWEVEVSATYVPVDEEAMAS